MDPIARSDEVLSRTGLRPLSGPSAVVPGFAQLIHGSRIYLAATSLIGLVAFGAGLQVILSASELALGVLMGAMGVLWLIATIHHVVVAEASAAAQPMPRAPVHGPRPAGIG